MTRLGLCCLVVLSCFVAATVIVGCGTVGNRSVVLQLNWTPDPTFTGEYVALKKNYWRNEGLDVRIDAGGFGVDPFAAVISGGAQFAVVGADKAIVAKANGAPIKVIAVDFQRNPVGWIARRSIHVNNFADIPSKPKVVLGDKVGTETSAIMELCLRRLGLSDKVTIRAVGFDFAYFLQNENVIYPVYLNEEPVQAKLKKVDIVEIDPADTQNGRVRMYGNVVVIHESLLKNNPAAVSGFLRGLKRGWKFAKENEDQAIALLKDSMRYDAAALPEVLRRSVTFATQLYGEPVPPGHMELREWEGTVRTMRESGLLKADINIKDLVQLDWASD